MELIKLNATTSTNDYLKQLALQHPIEDFTVVWAENQTQGKGQMGAEFVSQPFKNLTFSVYLRKNPVDLKNIFTLNCVVANAVAEALDAFNLTNIWIKWPNDILSYNKKIAGILIENNIKASREIQTIIGIGINILPNNFSKFPNASSVFEQYGVEIDREKLLRKIVHLLKERLTGVNEKSEAEWEKYHNRLFRKEAVSTFETPQGKQVFGVIKEVNREGQLVVQHENEVLKEYNLKEIKLLY
ncbi:MAG TPA: biotin--[acetyl-CoA-carboxylase] ligase [Flavobacterium sp.]|nr:biotin--[acetyl-CoA-carboxylase] ligase [Flavobacterium sp.]